MSALVEVRDICKVYNPGENEVRALDHVSLTINKGEFVAIIGQSGSGKSTLMNMLGCLDVPTSGKYYLNGKDVSKLTDDEQSDIRNLEIGFIFQGFNLLMQRTCLKNICFPLELAGVDKAEAKKRALELLEIVGLPDKANAYPAQLSGGQQQRIAIARALATEPKVLLCDEATSALDPKTTHSILELIRDINARLGITVIIITHHMSVVEEICSHVAILDDGKVVEEGMVSTVFSSPKSAAAKRLVFPDGADEIMTETPGERRIRVVFSGALAAKTPLIAQMAMEEQVVASILGASTRSIGDKAYGNMLLGITGGDEMVQRAMEYLSNIEDVLVEEVTDHV